VKAGQTNAGALRNADDEDDVAGQYGHDNAPIKPPNDEDPDGVAIAHKGGAGEQLAEDEANAAEINHEVRDGKEGESDDDSDSDQELKREAGAKQGNAEGGAQQEGNAAAELGPGRDDGENIDGDLEAGKPEVSDGDANKAEVSDADEGNAAAEADLQRDGDQERNLAADENADWRRAEREIGQGQVAGTEEGKRERGSAQDEVELERNAAADGAPIEGEVGQGQDSGAEEDNIDRKSAEGNADDERNAAGDENADGGPAEGDLGDGQNTAEEETRKRGKAEEQGGDDRNAADEKDADGGPVEGAIGQGQDMGVDEENREARNAEDDVGEGPSAGEDGRSEGEGSEDREVAEDENRDAGKADGNAAEEEIIAGDSEWENAGADQQGQSDADFGDDPDAAAEAQGDNPAAGGAIGEIIDADVDAAPRPENAQEATTQAARAGEGDDGVRGDDVVPPATESAVDLAELGGRAAQTNPDLKTAESRKAASATASEPAVIPVSEATVVPVTRADSPAARVQESEDEIEKEGSFMNVLLAAVFVLGLGVGVTFMACRRSMRRAAADADEGVPFNVDMGRRGYGLEPTGEAADELARRGFTKL
jgi:hypothetical protein